MEKRAPRLKQSVGILSYLFPSFFPSAFDLEAPLTLEEALARLEKLPRVRVSRAPAFTYDLLMPYSPLRTEIQTVSVAPIDLALARRDDDTYQYRADLSDARFKITVKGYLKRWESLSTVVTGRVYFDLHYAAIFVKSVLYSIGAGLVALVISSLLGIFTGLNLLAIFGQYPLLMLLPWLGVLVALWLNEVVVPAHIGRERLVTRIEDMVLLPGLGGEMSRLSGNVASD